MRRMFTKKEIGSGGSGGVTPTSKPYQVYTTNSAGEQTTTEYDTGNSSSVKDNSIAKRSGAGTLKANDPVENNDLVTKKYFEENKGGGGGITIDWNHPYATAPNMQSTLESRINIDLERGLYLITFTYSPKISEYPHQQTCLIMYDPFNRNVNYFSSASIKYKTIEGENNPVLVIFNDRPLPKLQVKIIDNENNWKLATYVNYILNIKLYKLI